MKRFTIIFIIALTIAATLGATAIPAQAEYKPAPAKKPASSLLTGLVSHWKLDEASSIRYDSFGANHLTSNNSTGQSTGVIGDSALFVSASAQSLSIADNSTLRGSSAFTVCGWINASVLSGTSIQMFRGWYGGAGGEWSLSYYQGGGFDKFIFGVRKADNLSTNYVIAISFGAASINTWNFICAFYDSVSGYISIEVNGGVRNSTTHSGGIYNGTNPLTFSYGYDGKIDSVSYYSRLLIPSETSALYNNGLGCDYPFSACESGGQPATSTPTATPSTETVTPTVTTTPTKTSTPTSTHTPNYIQGITLSTGNTLLVERRVTFGEVIVSAVGLLMVILFIAAVLYFGVIEWTR